MKRSDIKTELTYAVVTGSMYEGAEANAEPAIVLETGVAVDNFNGRSRWSRQPSSTTNDGVRIQLLDRQTMEPKRTMIVKSRNVIELWASHVATMRLRAERKAATAQRSQDSQAELVDWCERLGIQTYQLPSLSGGIRGGEGWDSEYTRNRIALARVLQAAYELGRKEAGKE